MTDSQNGHRDPTQYARVLKLNERRFPIQANENISLTTIPLICATICRPSNICKSCGVCGLCCTLNMFREIREIHESRHSQHSTSARMLYISGTGQFIHSAVLLMIRMLYLFAQPLWAEGVVRARSSLADPTLDRLNEFAEKRVWPQWRRLVVTHCHHSIPVKAFPRRASS